jgi:hypothetical protein
MTELLRLTEEQRRLIFTNAGFQAGWLPSVVEKDWWVTLTLKAIFQTEYAPYLLFKGGTSLSKCWKLINRFSEDIDLAIDREYLGYGGEISNTKIHALKEAACQFTSFPLKEAIAAELRKLGVPDGMVNINHKEIDPKLKDRDPQEIIIAYPTLFEPIEYIPNQVKIEVSGLSLKEPSTACMIQSIVGEVYPDQPFAGTPFEVHAVHPKRTFLEKMFLLHEEFQRGEKMRSFRMSRHLYDLESVMDSLYGWEALHDHELYHGVIAHRRKFYKLGGIDYDSHKPDTILFIPPQDILKAYDEDYAIMRTRMIQGNPPGFTSLLQRMEDLISRLRNPRHFVKRTITEVIEEARMKDPKDKDSPNFMIEGAEISIPLEYYDFSYRVFFTRSNGGLIEKSIRIESEK